ncbi:GNAT family N-acetyltransferase [Paenibacillus sp. PK3_47]|uniref:GNAT family N-acetyltransferase n=1 Tax=Paenibacillus sp. PK3_47 TaxID=2072642 RepID=UPI00201E287F|nr:GNAT family N-acetyltransferase [Paenibacillus sp. PK3_47]UQZ36409.1 GNAT family N-acetyltransferase [Paenibacillus sp. PK3_47]
MIIHPKEYEVKGLRYMIRSARAEDAEQLPAVRLQIDGETENMDREPGEAFIDMSGFEELIRKDTESKRNIFLVAEVLGRICGYSRCQGNELKRFAHKAEFGVGVLQEFWGYGIGSHLLQESIEWADNSGITRLTLNVLERNESAIRLYSKQGFEQEGILHKDKRLADGKYYNTILMARLKE